jgi:16S rRNA C1402 N4-methylase RsmH
MHDELSTRHGAPVIIWHEQLVPQQQETIHGARSTLQTLLINVNKELVTNVCRRITTKGI